MFSTVVRFQHVTELTKRRKALRKRRIVNQTHESPRKRAAAETKEIPAGNIYALPKGVKPVRKRLSDGSIATYHYWRATGVPIVGTPGTPEFAASVEATRGTKRQPKPTYEDRAYSGRLREFADRVAERAKFRAKARGLPFDITAQYVAELIRDQGERCALTRLKFETGGSKPGPFHPSLDRIDSRGGYVRGNLRVVCFAVNIALREWGEAVFLKIAKERRDKPLRMPELRRRGHLYIHGHLPQPSGVANELRILMALAEGRDPMTAPKPKISLAPGYQHELGL